LLLLLPGGLFGQGGKERRVFLLPRHPDLSSQGSLFSRLRWLPGRSDDDYLAAVVGEFAVYDAGVVAAEDARWGGEYRSLKTCRSREWLVEGDCSGVWRGSLRARLWLQAALCLDIFLLFIEAMPASSLVKHNIGWS
jgi:hypothetical protein